jgi:hypothetical protein
MNFRLITITLGIVAALLTNIAQAQQTPQERIFAIKALLGASTQALHQYQWIETTSVLVNGEEKSQSVKRCYYGPDGTVQKMPLSATPEHTARGLRGRIMAEEKAKMEAYMQSAAALMHSYVPPDPAKLQEASQTGNLAIQPQPNEGVRLTFSNYNKPGDSLSIDVDLTDNRLQDANVASYMDSESDAVTLSATWSVLPAGISYIAKITLNAPAKNITVNIVNSDYVQVVQ